MSVKAVRAAYNQICEQYFEMIGDIKDFEDEAARGLIEPERVERLKEQVEPIKQNYQRWAYIMYLLNEPTRKQKRADYKRRNKKLLESLDSRNSIEATIEENKDALAKIGN